VRGHLAVAIDFDARHLTAGGMDRRDLSRNGALEPLSALELAGCFSHARGLGH
jgi:hypothetical protein